MKNRRAITLSALLYTMIRRWKVMVISFIIVFALAAGYSVLKTKASGKEDGLSATVVALDQRNRDAVEGYRKYIEKSAYMNLDPNNLHERVIYYNITWKEEGLDPAVLESKYDGVYRCMVFYYPSDEFVKKIADYNQKYKEENLHEVVDVSRGGGTIIFKIYFTDDHYLNDLTDIIDMTIKEKTPEWASKIGSFELNRGLMTDEPIDGFASGHKAAQDEKRAILSQNQAAMETALTTKKETSAAPLSKQLVISAIIAFLAAIIVGAINSVYERRFYTSTDVYDIIGQDVISVLKSEPEAGLDRLFYKKNNKYHDPDLYLSIVDRRMAESGTKRVYLYNCSEEDLTVASEQIKKYIKNVETVNVDTSNNRDFFLNAARDEEVIILVKSGKTIKGDFLLMREHLDDLKIKVAGVVFVV